MQRVQYRNRSQGRPERPRKIGFYEPPPPPRLHGGGGGYDDDGVHKIYLGETATVQRRPRAIARRYRRNRTSPPTSPSDTTP